MAPRISFLTAFRMRKFLSYAYGVVACYSSFFFSDVESKELLLIVKDVLKFCIWILESYFLHSIFFPIPFAVSWKYKQTSRSCFSALLDCDYGRWEEGLINAEKRRRRRHERLDQAAIKGKEERDTSLSLCQNKLCVLIFFHSFFLCFHKHVVTL